MPRPPFSPRVAQLTLRAERNHRGALTRGQGRDLGWSAHGAAGTHLPELRPLRLVWRDARRRGGVVSALRSVLKSGGHGYIASGFSSALATLVSDMRHKSSLLVARGLMLGSIGASWLGEHLSATIEHVKPRVVDAVRMVRPSKDRMKRMLDLAVASSAALVLVPAIVVTAALVAISMGRPVIYSHPRVGKDGRLFNCLKFRSMVANSAEVLAQHLASDPAAAREWAEHHKLSDDPRVTALGRVLRKSSLDELPQLLNVLRGEMSCVGPRPITEAELVRYGRDAHAYLKVKPGMTGLWQVSGRSALSYADRVALDAHYATTWSLWGDVVIMARTVPAVMKTDQTA